MNRKTFLKKLPFAIAGLSFIALNKNLFKKSKTPDRFLRRQDDPFAGYITSERLNKEFKSLEQRLEKLEN